MKGNDRPPENVLVFSLLCPLFLGRGGHYCTVALSWIMQTRLTRSVKWNCSLIRVADWYWRKGEGSAVLQHAVRVLWLWPGRAWRKYRTYARAREVRADSRGSRFFRVCSKREYASNLTDASAKRSQMRVLKYLCDEKLRPEFCQRRCWNPVTSLWAGPIADGGNLLKQGIACPIICLLRATDCVSSLTCIINFYWSCSYRACIYYGLVNYRY